MPYYSTVIWLVDHSLEMEKLIFWCLRRSVWEWLYESCYENTTSPVVPSASIDSSLLPRPGLDILPETPPPRVLLRKVLEFIYETICSDQYWVSVKYVLVGQFQFAKVLCPQETILSVVLLLLVTYSTWWWRGATFAGVLGPFYPFCVEPGCLIYWKGFWSRNIVVRMAEKPVVERFRWLKETFRRKTHYKRSRVSYSW